MPFAHGGPVVRGSAAGFPLKSRAMSTDFASLPSTHVRRGDRAVTDEAWIRDFLARAPVGALATVHDGQPFVNQNLFVYDPESHAVYLHTARTGRTRANVEADGRASFSVSSMGRLLPAAEALEMSVEYAGVSVFGAVAVVDDPSEQRHALQSLLDKYFPHLTPGEDYRPITDRELGRTTVYRLTVESWVGKRKEAPEDFPGAFPYGEPPAD